MNLLSSKKVIFTVLSLGTVVFAGTMKDISSRHITKAHVAVATAPIERSVASEDKEVKVAVMTIDMKDAAKVNGKWEITRIVGSDEVVSFDKINNPEDAKKSIIVPLNLINSSKVMLNNDKGLVYNISLFSDFGTIAIFKKMGNGYEIIEAKKVKEVEVKEELVQGEIELFLERALNQSKSTKILTGSDAIGEMLLTKDSIESLRITLSNTNGEVQNIDIATVKLMDGGSFKAEVDGEAVSGVVFANGQDGYRLSFVTGPLAGAMLNFVTNEQKEALENKNNESNDNYYDDQRDEVKVAIEEVQPVEQSQALESRRIANENGNEPVVILSADEVKEVTENQGFSF